MKEVFLQCTQHALVPINEEGEEALRSYPKGEVLRVKITQKRSLPHHQFFFAFIREAFEKWPKDHAFPPLDENHLRAWLLVKVGIFEQHIVSDYPDTAAAKRAVSMVVTFLKRFIGDRPLWWRILDNGDIDFRWAKSIAFERMDEEEFRRVTTLVFTRVYVESGVDVDESAARWREKHGKLKVEPQKESGWWIG